MSLLSTITGPRDLDALSSSSSTSSPPRSASSWSQNVSRTGGHLGPNLGVVELTIAMHRVFDSPHDAIIFDTGHQSLRAQAPHRAARTSARLRTRGGLAGYPQRSESRARHRRSPRTPPAR